MSERFFCVITLGGAAVATCPTAREFADAVTAADLDNWKSEFDTVCAHFEKRWYRTESREHFRQYMQGLLAPLARKNSRTISEFTGERRPTAIQQFINLTPWDADGLRDEVRAYAMESFADSRAVPIADPTGFSKAYGKPAGVWTAGGGPVFYAGPDLGFSFPLKRGHTAASSFARPGRARGLVGPSIPMQLIGLPRLTRSDLGANLSGLRPRELVASRVRAAGSCRLVTIYLVVTAT